MHRLTRVSLTHRTVVALVTLIVLGVGVLTTAGLKQELLPSLDLPRARVVGVYPGAAPEAVEREVTKPLESAVKAVSGVSSVTSTSSSGVAQLTVVWDFGVDADKIQSDIRSAVDQSSSTLPQAVTTSVFAGSFDDIPVVMLALISADPPAVLAQKAKDIVLPALRTVPGVREVTLAGEQKPQVVIALREREVSRYGVDTTQLPAVFAAGSVAVPAGSMQTGRANLDVQVGSTFSGLDQIKNLRVQGADGPVTLSKIADVTEQPVESTSISRVDGAAALTVAVTKEAAGNTVSVAHGVGEALPGLASQLGGQASFATIFDQAPFIEQSIHDLTVEGGLGLLMAVLVIMVFLWAVRPTVITAISIPLSLVIALIGVRLGGYSLNILTLGALTVAIGRVVDDSIVVIENIKRHQSAGDVGFEATLRAVREVAGAVTSSTLTTVAVFLPIGLVGGQAGELFRPFAVTVTVALLASLVVSLTVIPVLASWFMRPGRSRAAEPDRAGTGAAPTAETSAVSAELVEEHTPAQRLLTAGYLPALRFALRRRLLTLLLASLFFAGSLALAPGMKTDFIREAGQTNLIISQDLPPGTSLAQSDAAAKKVEAVLAAEPTVTTYQTTVGGSASFFGAQQDTNHVAYTVTLAPKTQGQQTADRLRAQIARLPGMGRVEVSLGQQSNRVVVYVEGNDQKQLTKANDAVLRLLQQTGGLTNVRSDLSAARPMLTVTVDADRAAAAGMTQAQVGQAVSRALGGQKIGTMISGETTLDVRLRSGQPATTRDQLAAATVPVTPKQTMDAKTAAADRAAADSQAFQARQKAAAERAYQDSLATLRDSRAKAADQLDTLLARLGQLQRQLQVPPQPIAPDPYAAVKAQSAQLQAAIEAARAQIAGLDAQIGKARDSRASQVAAQAETEALSQAAKDAQKATASPLTVGDVAQVKEIPGPAVLTRVDGLRAATLTASPTGTDLGATTGAIRAGLAGLQLPAGVSVRIGGVSQQQQESFAQLGLAMLVAILVVYLIMVATFGSLLQPLILLASIPFAASGAIVGLRATDTPLGLPSMIGLLMLIGIVVTNAIVLIDLINQYRSHGFAAREATVNGARLRLRPIIMTAAATIFALIPMALGLTGGGVFISKPLAIVVIFGLLTSTVLTLIIVPVLYDLVEGLRRRRTARRERRQAARTRVARTAEG